MHSAPTVFWLFFFLSCLFTLKRNFSNELGQSAHRFVKNKFHKFLAGVSLDPLNLWTQPLKNLILACLESSHFSVSSRIAGKKFCSLSFYLFLNLLEFKNDISFKLSCILLHFQQPITFWWIIQKSNNLLFHTVNQVDWIYLEIESMKMST